jgi:cytochrome c oxidase cbb3-type subunit 3
MSPPDARDPLLLDHEYDGIQEYDNPLPRWWLWIFYATIAYSVLYWFNVPGIGIGAGRIAQYEADMAVVEAQRAEAAASHPGATEESLAALAEDDSTVAAGRTVFGQMCASCHGPDGGGVIGPNLTDAHWIHAGTALAIHTTITEGVPAKGMPAWGTMLRPDQVDAVTAYVLTLRGTTPSNPKAPEGGVGGVSGDSGVGGVGG